MSNFAFLPGLLHSHGSSFKNSCVKSDFHTNDTKTSDLERRMFSWHIIIIMLESFIGHVTMSDAYG